MGEDQSIRPSIKVGQFAIVRDSYSHDLIGPISKITPKQVQHPHRWRKGQVGSSDISRLIFWGSEQATTAVLERIRSSKVLRGEEHQASSNRHADREATIIERGFAGRFDPDTADTSEGKEIPGCNP